MPTRNAIYHRSKNVSIFPIEGDRFLITASLRDEVHDVRAEVEILHPSLEIVAARSEVRNGPFTEVCNMTHPNIERLVGMKVARGFTLEARKAVGGPGGCHRVSELLVEIAQAAYQLHFVRLFASQSREEREREDVPLRRHDFVLNNVPGMRDTCFSYSTANRKLVEEKATPLRRLEQDMPTRNIDDTRGED
ncbi:MAG: DUF2889 domain-containing protein [Deltaproteobacteria bacterium]|nr:DUF2889 domain-containing protein [Deltaproteobacteria bacterium]